MLWHSEPLAVILEVYSQDDLLIVNGTLSGHWKLDLMFHKQQRLSTLHFFQFSCHFLHTRTWIQVHRLRAAAKGSQEAEAAIPVTDLAKRALNCAANSTRQIGWFSFWTQLALSIVSAVILLFSVAFTSQVECLDLNLWNNWSRSELERNVKVEFMIL